MPTLQLLSTGRDGVIKVWDAASGESEQEAHRTINVGSSAEAMVAIGAGRAITAKRAGLVELWLWDNNEDSDDDDLGDDHGGEDRDDDGRRRARSAATGTAGGTAAATGAASGEASGGADGHHREEDGGGGFGGFGGGGGRRAYLGDGPTGKPVLAKHARVADLLKIDAHITAMAARADLAVVSSIDGTLALCHMLHDRDGAERGTETSAETAEEAD